MGRYKAAVFDWAGTMIDFGSFAPMGVFVAAFGTFGVEVGVGEARRWMGLPKRDHIRGMLHDPAIAGRWRDATGSEPDEEAVDAVYDIFVPLNVKVAADFATLVPGAAAVAADLRARGMKIGSTTGYTRAIMEPILPIAAAQGYAPDNLVCADDLPIGRPTPMGMYKCFLDLLVYPASAVIKVDDTVPGIAEGVAAGCLAVGVTLSGNEAGLSADQLAQLAPAERQALHERVGATLIAAGAHHVVETVADLPALLDALDARDRGLTRDTARPPPRSSP